MTILQDGLNGNQQQTSLTSQLFTHLLCNTESHERSLLNHDPQKAEIKVINAKLNLGGFSSKMGKMYSNIIICRTNV